MVAADVIVIGAGAAGLVFGLIFGLQRDILAQRSHPNEGIHRSFRNMLVTALLGWLVAEPLGGLVVGLLFGGETVIGS